MASTGLDGWPIDDVLPTAGASTTQAAVQWAGRRVRNNEIQNGTARRQVAILFDFARTVGNPQVGRIRRQHVDRWLAGNAHLAAGTRRNMWGTLHLFLTDQVDTAVLRRHPMAGMRPPRVPKPVHRALTPTEAAALLAVCHDERDRVIVTLGFQLGLRRIEITRLEMGDISLSADIVDVVGKRGARRRLPLTADARSAILAYISAEGIRAGPLIRSHKFPNRGVQPGFISKRVSDLCWEAGIKARNFDGVSMHATRHTCASDIYEQTNDPLAVAEMLGHENLANTQRYVRRLNVERLRRAAEGRHYDTPRAASEDDVRPA